MYFFPSGFQIGVKNIQQARNKREADTPEFGTYLDSPNAYIAGEVNRSDTKFLVGDGQVYGGYENPALIEGQEYEIYVAVVSQTPNEVTIYAKKGVAPGMWNSVFILTRCIYNATTLFVPSSCPGWTIVTPF